MTKDLTGDWDQEPPERLEVVLMDMRSGGRGRGRALRWGALIVLVLAAGLWLRSLPPLGVTSDLTAWRPWGGTVIATLYFTDGPFLFPVSRRMAVDDDELPRATLQALLAGPGPRSGLTSAIPQGVEIRSFAFADGVARVDLSGDFPKEHPGAEWAERAIVETLTALPAVSTVALSVDGEPLAEPAASGPLLYYASAKGLAAVPVSAADPRAALDAYLAGPPAGGLEGLPRDVRVLNYDFDPADGLVTVNLAYTPSVRQLALDDPGRMRLLLLGLIAGLTEFPYVQAVQIEFEDQARLGLGECSDLLRTPQPRPRLLNDERLLGG